MIKKFWYSIFLLSISACNTPMPTMVYMRGAETFMVDYNEDGKYDAEWLSLDQANNMDYQRILKTYIVPGNYRWAQLNEIALLYSILGSPGNSKATIKMGRLAKVDNIQTGLLYTGITEQLKANDILLDSLQVQTMGWYGGKGRLPIKTVQESTYFPALIKKNKQKQFTDI